MCKAYFFREVFEIRIQKIRCILLLLALCTCSSNVNRQYKCSEFSFILLKTGHKNRMDVVTILSDLNEVITLREYFKEIPVPKRIHESKPRAYGCILENREF